MEEVGLYPMQHTRVSLNIKCNLLIDNHYCKLKSFFYLKHYLSKKNSNQSPHLSLHYSASFDTKSFRLTSIMKCYVSESRFSMTNWLLPLFPALHIFLKKEISRENRVEYLIKSYNITSQQSKIPMRGLNERQLTLCKPSVILKRSPYVLFCL